MSGVSIPGMSRAREADAEVFRQALRDPWAYVLEADIAGSQRLRRVSVVVSANTRTVWVQTRTREGTRTLRGYRMGTVRGFIAKLGELGLALTRTADRVPQEFDRS